MWSSSGWDWGTIFAGASAIFEMLTFLYIMKVNAK